MNIRPKAWHLEASSAKAIHEPIKWKNELNQVKKIIEAA